MMANHLKGSTLCVYIYIKYWDQLSYLKHVESMVRFLLKVIAADAIVYEYLITILMQFLKNHLFCYIFHITHIYVFILKDVNF